jgi:pyrrolysine biosynthesis protein PylC
LAEKAGWETLLCDRKKDPPALNLAGSFFQADWLTLSLKEIERLCSNFDLIIPALEDKAVLNSLYKAKALNIIPPVAHDFEAYEISSSKLRSKKLFQELNIDCAASWRPGAFGDFMVKPDDLSGSRGVRHFFCSKEVEEVFPDERSRKGLVVEEFLDGPSYSLEVTAKDGVSLCFEVTQLCFDNFYDCRMVIAPSSLSENLEQDFKAAAHKLAKALKLTGIMDLEIIVARCRLRLLEIDARFPSQTPIVVYFSSSDNLVERLASCYLDYPLPPAPSLRSRKVVLEHVLVRPGLVESMGEHIMTNFGPLTRHYNFMGAREALVAGNIKTGKFAATLIKMED